MLKKLGILCGMLLVALVVLTPSGMSDVWNKKTVVTVGEPMVIPGATLQPGKYVFKLADSLSNRHIVQVFNEDESQVIATILAIPNDRLEPADGTILELWETPVGAPKALRAWFYPGDSIGQEFRYPKEEATTLTAQIHQDVPALTEEDQSVLNSRSETNQSASTQPSTEPPQSEQPAPAPPPEQPVTESAANSNAAPAQEMPRSESTEQATTTSESQAHTDMAQPEPAQTQQRTVLPRTASFLPLTGLTGLLALGAAVIVRFSRLS